MSSAEKVVMSEQAFRMRFIYEQSDVLGEGGFARVYKAYDQQFEETVALKFYTKTDVDKYDIISEMKHSRKFTHKNVIRVHDACIVRFTNSFGVTEDVQVGILEFANAGNLSDFLKTAPSEEDFRSVLIGILHGLHYLHAEKGVIHRDLSPDNILMFKDQNKWIPKIADFGISKGVDVKTIHMGSQKASSELVGKMEYMAPEQFDPAKFGINNRIATNVDLWAFGIVLTEIFTDSTPFGDRNKAQSPMQIMHNVLHAPLPAHVDKIPEPYRKIIRQCLVKQATKRIKSAQGLIDMLSLQEKPKKKDKKVLMLISLAALLVVVGLLGFFYSWGNNPEVPESLPKANNQQVEKVKVEKVMIATEDQQTVSEKGGDEKVLRQNPEGINGSVIDVLENKKKEEATEIGKSQNRRKKEAPASIPEKSDVQMKEELVQKLTIALNHLDNDIIKPHIREKQIHAYISEIFVNGQIPVVLEENGSTSQQKIQEFMEYVVKTAGMENRKWEVDGTLTKFQDERISELKLSRD